MTTELVKWYKKNMRDLPWRKTKDPYRIWVSEIILQQTQIKAGLNYYIKFLEFSPNIQHLANSTDDQILKIWQGLGYYNRALNMLHTAKFVIKNHNGVFPKKYKHLIKLKGVGQYTAAAISSICNGEKYGVVDGNVYRVLSRFYNISEPINTTKGKKIFQNIANKLVPPKNPGTYNQAIMDFGAIHCKKYNPKCITCPIQNNCQAFKLNLTHLRPVKMINKKYRLRYFNYLLIGNDKKIIIQKRTKKDIWSRLYHLPLIESATNLKLDEIIKDDTVEEFNITAIKKQTTIRHVLSHQKLEITFWIITVKHIPENTLYQKINLKDISKYPFPKPLKKFLEIQARTV